VAAPFVESRQLAQLFGVGGIRVQIRFQLLLLLVEQAEFTPGVEAPRFALPGQDLILVLIGQRLKLGDRFLEFFLAHQDFGVGEPCGVTASIAAAMLIEKTMIRFTGTSKSLNFVLAFGLVVPQDFVGPPVPSGRQVCRPIEARDVQSSSLQPEPFGKSLRTDLRCLFF
jgi:hypothetical protein